MPGTNDAHGLSPCEDARVPVAIVGGSLVTFHTANEPCPNRCFLPFVLAAEYLHIAQMSAVVSGQYFRFRARIRERAYVGKPLALDLSVGIIKRCRANEAREAFTGNDRVTGNGRSRGDAPVFHDW